MRRLFDSTVARKKRKDTRYRRACPVPGCSSKPQVKLSQHLVYKHPGLSHIEKQRYLKLARRVDKPRQKQHADAKQPTLTQVLLSSQSRPLNLEERATGEEDDASIEGEAAELEVHPVSSDHQDDRFQDPTAYGDDPLHNPTESGGTRNFPRFDVRHPIFYCFQDYLKSLDGGGKSDKTAHEMSVDVAKYLRYACGPDCPSPDWSRLVDRDQMMGYMEKLKRAGWVRKVGWPSWITWQQPCDT